MINIIKSQDFVPHIALCHMELNQGSANEENIPLVMKAKGNEEKLNEVLTALGEATTENINKASMRALSDMIQYALKEHLIQEYVWIADFDGETVVFESNQGYKAVAYSIDEEGNIAFGESKVVHTYNQYIDDDGEYVLKSVEAAEEETQEEEADAPQEEALQGEEEIIEEENKEIEMTEQQIAEIVAKARQEERQQIEAEQAAAKLQADTQEIVKSFSFIEEGEVENVVKCLIESEESATLIVKAFEAAKTAIEAKDAEIEQIRKEFGNAEQITDEAAPVVEKGSLAEIMKANVAAMKAKASK